MIRSRLATKIILAILWLLVKAPCADGDSPDVDALSEPPPNILLLIGDDIDRDSLGPWGGHALTPNLDRLAAGGMRFDRVYANVAMCAPFRQELYSGRCCWRTLAMPNHSRSVPGTRSLPHYLRPLGYRVGLLGKRHVGPRECYPFDRVGDFPPREDNNARAVELARDYVTSARDGQQPFCLVIASNDGHSPFTNGDRSVYDPEVLPIDQDKVDTDVLRRQLVAHFAEVSHLDSLLGQLLDLLETEGLSGNTIVIFCSEQGNAFPFSKWTCFDDGLASGIVASLPGRIPAGATCDQMFWISDLAPTLMEMAGGDEISEDFDGRSQWRNFQGGREQIHRYAFGAFTNCNIIDNRERVFPVRSIRDSRYSLIWSPRAAEEITSNVTLSQSLEFATSGLKPAEPDTAASWAVRAGETETDEDDFLVRRFFERPEWALYDRENDPEELTNLIDDPAHSEAAQRLRSELETWLEGWNDSDPVQTEQEFVRKR